MADIFILGPDAAGNCCTCAARTNPCDSCGEIEGGCFLDIPGCGNRLADLTAAQSIIEHYVASCLMWLFEWSDNTLANLISLSTSVITNGLNIAASSNTFIYRLDPPTTYRGRCYMRVSVSVPANTIVTAAFTNSAGPYIDFANLNGCSLQVYDSNCALVTESLGNWGTSESRQVTITAAGTYELRVSSDAIFIYASPSVQVFSTSVNLTTNKTSVFNPAIASYGGGSSLSCSTQCISQSDVLTNPGTSCSTTTTSGTDCETTYAVAPGPGSGCPLRQSASVRLILGGLTVGVSYVATVHFRSTLGNTSSTSFNFTATLTSYTTAYTSVPSATASEGWRVVDCEVTGGGSSSQGGQLEACPKMLLPVFTELTGDWYSGLGGAQAVIHDYVLDCFAYLPNGRSNITTSLGAVHLSYPGFGINVQTFFSVNLVKGASITAVANVASNAPGGCGPSGPPNCSLASAIIVVYDDSGEIVSQNTSGTLQEVVSASTSTSFTAPYTGRYMIQGAIFSNSWVVFSPTYSTTGLISITGGTITNNSVQALYDVGLDCPARLNC